MTQRIERFVHDAERSGAEQAADVKTFVDGSFDFKHQATFLLVARADDGQPQYV